MHCTIAYDRGMRRNDQSPSENHPPIATPTVGVSRWARWGLGLGVLALGWHVGVGRWLPAWLPQQVLPEIGRAHV